MEIESLVVNVEDCDQIKNLISGSTGVPQNQLEMLTLLSAAFKLDIPVFINEKKTAKSFKLTKNQIMEIKS